VEAAHRRPWRDLPERYRPWRTHHERLQVWTDTQPADDHSGRGGDIASPL